MMMPEGRRASGIRLLETPHATSIILYVREHDGCSKSDVYADVSHNSTMPRKISDLTGEGILVQERVGKADRLHLSEKGMELAEWFVRIRDALEGS